MNQAQWDAQHAQCVAQSRANAVRYAREAEEAATRGDRNRAAECRRWAELSREEADYQEAAGAGRVPRTIHTAGQHPAEPPEPGPIYRRVTLLPLGE